MRKLVGFGHAERSVGETGKTKKEGIISRRIGQMEQEMESLEHDVKAVKETYGENMLNLTLARGYIKKLLDNAKVVRFLNANYSDIFSGFENIVATETV